MLELQHESLVVETGGEEVDIADLEAAELGQMGVRVPHRMAKAIDARERRRLVHRPRQHRHRVRVVEEIGVWAVRNHVAGEPDDDRNRAQPAEDATDAKGVSDRLTDPVAGGDVEVDACGVVTADLDLVDHVGRSVERRLPLEVGAHLGSRSALADDPSRQILRESQPVLPDVMQRDLDLVAELREAAQVRYDVACEFDAACADEGDLDHRSTLPEVSRTCKNEHCKDFGSARSDGSEDSSTSSAPPACL